MDENNQNPPNSPQSTPAPATDFSGFDPIDNPYDPNSSPKIAPTPSVAPPPPTPATNTTPAPNPPAPTANTPQQPPERDSKYKINARISGVITVTSAFVFIPILLNVTSSISYRDTFLRSFMQIMTYVSPFAISIFMWILSLIKKKDGAHGWIAGPLIVIAIGLTIFGGCLLLIATHF